MTKGIFVQHSKPQLHANPSIALQLSCGLVRFGVSEHASEVFRLRDQLLLRDFEVCDLALLHSESGLNLFDNTDSEVAIASDNNVCMANVCGIDRHDS